LADQQDKPERCSPSVTFSSSNDDETLHSNILLFSKSMDHCKNIFLQTFPQLSQVALELKFYVSSGIGVKWNSGVVVVELLEFIYTYSFCEFVWKRLAGVTLEEKIVGSTQGHNLILRNAVLNLNAVCDILAGNIGQGGQVSL
jgi:hypothetical protein